MMGHLISFSASGGGNLNKNFAKNSNARGLPGGGGLLKLRFDWYIKLTLQGIGRFRIHLYLVIMSLIFVGWNRTGILVSFCSVRCQGRKLSWGSAYTRRETSRGTLKVKYYKIRQTIRCFHALSTSSRTQFIPDLYTTEHKLTLNK